LHGLAVRATWLFSGSEDTGVNERMNEVVKKYFRIF